MADSFDFRLRGLAGLGGVRGVLGLVFGRRPVAVPVERAAGSAAPVAGAAQAGHTAPIQIAGSQPNWLRLLTAHELLQVVQAGKALREIWRKSRFSQPVFERDCLAALHRYAEFVQLLPASEAHHHAHAGGLLTHTVEMLLAAMTWRNAHLLPENSPIEVIDAQRDEWTLVVFYAALLHDIGKVLTDLRITWRGKDVDPVRWMPLAGPLNDLAQGRADVEYLVEFAPKIERDYSAHSRTAVMLLQRMASPTALAILARQPAAFEALNRYLSGQDRDSLVAHIVREADKASARRALASGSRARFATAQAVPLVDLLMQSVRSMLRAGTVLPLNRSGAAGWVFEGAIWFVAKRVADATRDWIKKHEPEEAVPGETKNDRLFDTWQEYGCIQLNPHTGQAVWYVTVHGQASSAQAGEGGEAATGAYRHQLTMLRFPLDKLFGDPSQYPPPMLGMIEVHDKRKAAADVDDEAPQAEDDPVVHDEAEAAPGGPPPADAGLEPLNVPQADVDVRRTSHTTDAGAGGREAAAVAPDGKKRAQGGATASPPIKAPSFNRPRPDAKHEAKPGRKDAAKREGVLPSPQSSGGGEPGSGVAKSEAAATATPRATSTPDGLRTTPVFAPLDDAAYLLDADDAPDAGAPTTRGTSRAPVTANAARKPRHEAGAMIAPKALATTKATAPAMQRRTSLALEPTLPPAASVPQAAPTPTPSAAAADWAQLLAQPVGGSRPRLLAGSAPAVAARTRVAAAPAQVKPPTAQDAGTAPGQPRPVLLEPQLPTLPKLPQSDTTGRRAAEPSALAVAFITWIQSGLASRELKYNETGAAVHFVPEGMALVSPLIFKLYAATRVPEVEIADEALRIQREVVKAGWHHAAPNKMNILRYAVVARAGTESGRLAAVVLTEPGRFVQPVPPSNPVLKLV